MTFISEETGVNLKKNARKYPFTISFYRYMPARSFNPELAVNIFIKVNGEKYDVFGSFNVFQYFLCLRSTLL